MIKRKHNWITLCLFNLAVVALLGAVLRSKILFSIPWLDFKYILNAHSHFAFGGWITLCLLTLFTFELLPAKFSGQRKYNYLLGGIFLTAAGMLLSFPFQGYGFWSISFSTLFIFATYAFSWCFIRDLRKSAVSPFIFQLAVVSLASLCISSVGPFTLAYMLATHSVNLLLYKDSIYTYLHLQYNGFFTLAVFAVWFAKISDTWSGKTRQQAVRFAGLLSAAVLPTLFLSYLWHYPNILIRSLAAIGCIMLLVCLHYFSFVFKAAWTSLRSGPKPLRILTALAMTAFVLKTLMQAGIVFPELGALIFDNRPVIIGYLHLVMLGFVTTFLLAHFFLNGYLNFPGKTRLWGIAIFTTAVIVNELLLMTQGLAAMCSASCPSCPIWLWVTALFLLAGAMMTAIGCARCQRSTGRQISTETRKSLT
ncbi:hypothetical protein G7092_02160 [Mucilaginibacter sp. HC2]|uniref:hypothetical protein n=1 Tax=Mucilaginibacter inviolabilis TaxID=2714892 RepID=UPI00140BDE93|nr:hypothetical protein [Mucilaginibacter inviolabilis]NHA02579.1 hypothetical protein [Mucilaginibacter inviolabilis]